MILVISGKARKGWSDSSVKLSTTLLRNYPNERKLKPGELSPNPYSVQHFDIFIAGISNKVKGTAIT